MKQLYGGFNPGRLTALINLKVIPYLQLIGMAVNLDKFSDHLQTHSKGFRGEFVLYLF